MTLQTLSLLDQARAQSPNSSDASCIERVAAQVIDELDERPPISLEVVASFRDIRDSSSGTPTVCRIADS